MIVVVRGRGGICKFRSMLFIPTYTMEMREMNGGRRGEGRLVLMSMLMLMLMRGSGDSSDVARCKRSLRTRRLRLSPGR